MRFNNYKLLGGSFVFRLGHCTPHQRLEGRHCASVTALLHWRRITGAEDLASRDRVYGHDAQSTVEVKSKGAVGSVSGAKLV